MSTSESVFADTYIYIYACIYIYIYIYIYICMYIHIQTQYGPPQTKPKHDLFVEALSYFDPLIKDGYGLTVTEIKDLSNLAENYDSALYNRYSKMRVLDNYNDTIQFCPSYQFNVPMKYAFHQILA